MESPSIRLRELSDEDRISYLYELDTLQIYPDRHEESKPIFLPDDNFSFEDLCDAWARFRSLPEIVKIYGEPPDTIQPPPFTDRRMVLYKELLPNFVLFIKTDLTTKDPTAPLSMCVITSNRFPFFIRRIPKSDPVSYRFQLYHFPYTEEQLKGLDLPFQHGLEMLSTQTERDVSLIALAAIYEKR